MYTIILLIPHLAVVVRVTSVLEPWSTIEYISSITITTCLCYKMAFSLVGLRLLLRVCGLSKSWISVTEDERLS